MSFEDHILAERDIIQKQLEEYISIANYRLALLDKKERTSEGKRTPETVKEGRKIITDLKKYIKPIYEADALIIQSFPHLKLDIDNMSSSIYPF